MMIQFFRKIRKGLLLKNNFVKYLAYAVGEIILVVIGILIALEFNNWNENRIKRKVEINLLEGIRNDILRDTIDLSFNIRGYQSGIQNDSILLDHLISKKPYNSKVAFLLINSLANFNLTLHSSHFEEIKVRGWAILSNKTLKDEISRLYEFDYAALKGYFNTNEDQHINSYFNQVSNYLGYTQSGYVVKKEAYNSLISDDHFFLLLKVQIQKRNWMLKNHEKTLRKSLHVKELIDKELETIKK